MSADAEEHTGNGTRATGEAGSHADKAGDDGSAGSDLDELGYEQARDELAEVVRTLEAGGLSLEDSLALWERGESLANRCERHLAGARERIETALAVVTDEAEPDDAQPDNGHPGNA